MEWDKLIVHDHLTISTNLFGTTFYSLVGLHASHVIVGLMMMLVVLVFALTGNVAAGARVAREGAGAVLALCGCGVGGGLHGGVRGGKMTDLFLHAINQTSLGELHTHPCICPHRRLGRF